MPTPSPLQALGPALIEALPWPLAIETWPDRRCIVWNPALERLLGIPAPRALNRGAEAWLDDRQAAAWRETGDQAARTARPTTLRLSLPRPEGADPLVVEVRFQVLASGRQRHLLAGFHLLAPAPALEEELRRTRRAMIADSHAIRQLFARLDHEVKTSLHSITTLLEQMLEQDLSPRAREMAETTLVTAIAIADTLQETSTLLKSRRRHLPLDRLPFDPVRLLEQVIERNAEAASRRHHHLTMHVQTDVPATVIGDPACLEQVLHNLLSNFIEGLEQGVIGIELSALVEPGQDTRLRFTYSGLTADLAQLVPAAGSGSLPRAPLLQQERRIPSLDFSLGWHVAETLGGDFLVRPGGPSESAQLVFSCPFQPAADPVEPWGPPPVLQGKSFLIAHPHAPTRAALAAQLETWGGKAVAIDRETQIARLLSPTEGASPQPSWEAIFLDALWTSAFSRPQPKGTTRSPGSPKAAPSSPARPLFEAPRQKGDFPRLAGIPCFLIHPHLAGDPAGITAATVAGATGHADLFRPLLASRLLAGLAALFPTTNADRPTAASARRARSARAAPITPPRAARSSQKMAPTPRIKGRKS
ncbi:MAG: BarA sensory histidine kinase [Candidatus Ozemobacter sibiricus]|uniref:BarA sensory histidine kinase n=1 Tax=Candidatus Ozemobacter sibiricus TaxID=2268124 RepID=A0A367ZPU4_9BACT|nr:MAG: BarA sensory histidine kinase [Candidatus Ozemobacter sibiricus]